MIDMTKFTVVRYGDETNGRDNLEALSFSLNSPLAERTENHQALATGTSYNPHTSEDSEWLTNISMKWNTIIKEALNKRTHQLFNDQLGHKKNGVKNICTNEESEVPQDFQCIISRQMVGILITVLVRRELSLSIHSAYKFLMCRMWHASWGF
ncbi:hypothetical protein Lal_00024867 [Lupinus albus]|nr:hypothetical protein Lal_00024867 [Lupinus albus]